MLVPVLTKVRKDGQQKENQYQNQTFVLKDVHLELEN